MVFLLQTSTNSSVVRTWPHFTTVIHSFCSIPHGSVSLASNQHPGQLQNRYSDQQHSDFWPSGIPSWINLSIPTSYSLRSSNQLLLTVHHANLTTGQCTFSHSSPVTWNVIPLYVRDAPSISTFKCHLKSFYFYSLICPHPWFKPCLTVLRVINLCMCVCTLSSL